MSRVRADAGACLAEERHLGADPVRSARPGLRRHRWSPPGSVPRRVRTTGDDAAATQRCGSTDPPAAPSTWQLIATSSTFVKITGLTMGGRGRPCGALAPRPFGWRCRCQPGDAWPWLIPTTPFRTPGSAATHTATRSSGAVTDAGAHLVQAPTLDSRGQRWCRHAGPLSQSVQKLLDRLCGAVARRPVQLSSRLAAVHER